VNTVTILRIPLTARNCLTSSATVSFSSRTVLNGVMYEYDINDK
jgi:hypothetical protein